MLKKKKTHKVQQEQTWLPQGRWVCSWGARRTRLSWQNGRCSAPFWSLARRPSTCGSTGRFLPACLAGYTWEKMNKEKQLKKGWVLHADKLSLTLSSIAGSKYLEMRAFPFNIELNSIKNCDKHILGNISDYDCLLCVESRRLTPWGVIRHPLLSTNSWWHTKCILWQIVQCFTLDFFFLPKKIEHTVVALLIWTHFAWVSCRAALLLAPIIPPHSLYFPLSCIALLWQGLEIGMNKGRRLGSLV